MKRYICPFCGYEYVVEDGDLFRGGGPGVRFEDLPDDWVCPFCGTPKERFIVKK